MRIARLYLLAGSPSRAIGLFREVLLRQPQDSDAYGGLGEAEFALGNYRAARTDFQAALRLNPADEHLRKRLALCEDVLALDPTQRGLIGAERYRRSLKLIELASDGMSRCVGTPPSASARDLATRAQQALKSSPAGRGHRNESGTGRAIVGRAHEGVPAGSVRLRRAAGSGDGQAGAVKPDGQSFLERYAPALTGFAGREPCLRRGNAAPLDRLLP
jgi:tetratricopeptide (TPR) repeat protein